MLKKRKEKFIKRLMSSDDFARCYAENCKIDRARVKICFLDDEGYTSVDKLKALGYTNVDVKYEFNSLEEFNCYDVIFCDIQGIGKSIYPRNQGFDVAVELKKMYKNCNVFIYTGKDLSLYPPMPEEIKYISKQTPMKEIVSILDKECEYLWNPVVAWRQHEQQFRKMNVPNKYIALFEDKFFSSLVDGTNELSLGEEIKSTEIYNDIKFCVGTLVSLIDIILRFQGR